MPEKSQLDRRVELPRLLSIAEAEEATGAPLRGRVYQDGEFARRCVVRLGQRGVRIRADRLAEFIDERTGTTKPQRYKYTKKPGRPSNAERERRRKAAAES